MRRQWIIRCWDQLQTRPEGQRRWADLERAIGERLPRDLPGILDIGGDAFQRLRYIYEEPFGLRFFGLDDFPDVVRSAILNIYPDWKTVNFKPLPVPS